MINAFDSESVKTVSELIQLSIAPVFMLAGIAGFLNVFTGRLARIVDRIEKIRVYKENHKQDTKEYKIAAQRDVILMKRMENTNRAILLMSTTGLLIALVMIGMFLSAIFGFKDSLFISILFILSMTSLIVALILFSIEIIHTATSVKSRKDVMP